MDKDQGRKTQLETIARLPHLHTLEIKNLWHNPISALNFGLKSLTLKNYLPNVLKG
jgi:hypothetical protein